MSKNDAIRLFMDFQRSLISPNFVHFSGHRNSNDIAIEFATVFYKGIAAGQEIGFSFELAKNSVDLHNIPGSDIPEII
jgi:hypothetical protein